LEFKEQKTVITDTDRFERKQIADKVKADIDSKEFEFITIANKYKDQYENVIYLSGSGTKDDLPEEAVFT
jgi:hypothetical protein